MTARIIKGPKSTFEKDFRGLGEFYFNMAGKHGDKICQLNPVTGQNESFSSVKRRSTRLAINLRKLGLNTEDVVLVCAGNNLDSLIPILASFYLGAKVSCLDRSLAVKEIVHGISMLKPRYVFVEDSVELIEKSLLEANHKAEIIVIAKSSKYKMFSDLELASEEENCFRPVAVKDCQDTAFIYFSSGTTGLPKGICITHYGLINSIKALLTMDVMKTDVQIHFASFSWISTAMFMTKSFLTGGCRILATTFDAVKVFEWTEKYKINYMNVAPTFVYHLTNVDNPEKYDTSSIYSLTIGGRPFSTALQLKAQQVFKHSLVTIGYGCSEATGYITTFDLTRDKHLLDRLGSAGKCVVDMEVKIVEIETGKLLGPNQKGEVLCKTPYQMKGYYNIDSSSIYDEDGFIKTGDIAYYDEDKCVYIIDRIKDTFRYKCWPITPATIEVVLQDHPAVVEAVVIGIPHEIDGNIPAACVVVKSAVFVNDIEKFVAERVSDWHKLRGGIKIVDAIEKTPSGKIQRNKMKEIFMNMI